MPKVKIAAYQEAKQRIEDDNHLIALLNKNLTLMGLNKKELAAALGMPKDTMYYRFRNPGTFRRDELQRIFAVLRFSPEDKAAVRW